MSSQKIGSVKSPNTEKQYEVKWNSYGRSVYIRFAGWTKVGDASSAGQAMQIAEAYLYNK